MSLYDYNASKEIDAKQYPFYALIMAAMRQADDKNLIALKTVFLNVFKEFKARYNAPGGFLEGENNKEKNEKQ